MQDDSDSNLQANFTKVFSIEQMIEILLGRQPWRSPMKSSEAVPDYLQQEYARESVAAWLGNLANPTSSVINALIQASMNDQNEGVRNLALKSIQKLTEKERMNISEAIEAFFAATQDNSSKVRCTALECLWSINEDKGREAAIRLASDPDWVVAETARSIVNASA